MLKEWILSPDGVVQLYDLGLEGTDKKDKKS